MCVVCACVWYVGEVFVGVHTTDHFVPTLLFVGKSAEWEKVPKFFDYTADNFGYRHPIETHDRDSKR